MENNFVFESVGLTQKSAPIIRYDWDRRKMKKDEWRKYERRIYEQAGVFARSTGASQRPSATAHPKRTPESTAARIEEYPPNHTHFRSFGTKRPSLPPRGR